MLSAVSRYYTPCGIFSVRFYCIFEKPRGTEISFLKCNPDPTIFNETTLFCLSVFHFKIVNTV